MVKVSSGSVLTSEVKEFLSDKNSYPEKPERVEVKETHMSFVFLTDQYVYKMKKPVLFPYVDLSTLSKRKHNCEEEVVVNRRLADGFYKGIVSVRRDSRGNLELGEKGEAVEWLVKMVRLPESQMMDFKISGGKILEKDLIKLGKKLAEFYSRPHSVKLDLEFYIQRLRNFLCSNLNDLKDPVFGLGQVRLNRLFHKQLKFISDNFLLLEKRTEKIVDAHGDLKPEHICLTEDPVVVDSLEFNRDLRILDPLEELAYLSLECEMLESKWTGENVIEIYKRETGDHSSDEIIRFYKSIRAVLRALNSFRHIKEARYRNEPKWIIRGERYLELAEKYAAK